MLCIKHIELAICIHQYVAVVLLEIGRHFVPLLTVVMTMVVVIVPRVGLGYPLFTFALSLSIPFLIYYSLLLFLSFFLIHFTYFLLLSIRSLSTRIVPLRFQARGRRR